jgi:hypothetical protein
MANMSYCRFENTLSDLEDCRDALDRGDSLSEREAKKAKALIDLCREIADNYDDDYVDSLKEEDEEEED